MTRKARDPKDVVTLADLAPRKRVTGGTARRVFGSDAPEKPAGSAGARRAAKDLPAKGTTVKGGRLAGNDSLTLVRAAKPAKRDLPAGKDVKAGKKAR